MRENFIDTVFVYRRWRNVVAEHTAQKVVDFHTAHKLLLRSHSENHYRQLGRIVAKAGVLEPDELLSSYQEALMAAMRLKPTIKKHYNVLLHMMGHFKKSLSADEKQELLEVFDNFKKGNLPLIVPITLLGHYTRKYQENYLQQQIYLRPHPIELKLRNHA